MKTDELIESIESLPIIDDFNDFLDYFKNNKVKLTKAGRLGPKDCFKIDKLLFHAQLVAHDKVQLPKYTAISFFFYVGLAIRLIQLDKEKSTVFIKINEEQFEYFQSFNKVEKYFSLLKGLWTKCDINALKEDDYNSGMIEGLSFLLDKLAENIEQKKKNKNVHLESLGQIIKQLGFMGWWEFTEKEYQGFNRKFVDDIRMNPLGKFMIPKLTEERHLLEWNIHGGGGRSNLFGFDEVLFMNDFVEEDENDDEGEDDESFLDVFKKELGENVLGKELHIETETQAGTYIFKVKLNNKIWRVIRIPGSCFLDELHKAILDAYGFDNDHLFVFYPGGKLYSGIGYHDERGDGPTPLACETKIEDLGLVEGQTMKYLFDFGDHWEFDVVLEEVSGDDSVLDGPELIKSKGDAPEQYPDYDEDENW